MSVSLPDDDVAFIDEFLERSGDETRSAVLQRAISMLRAVQLADSYDVAFREWHESGEADVWDVAVGDGLH